ncbi:lipopolysaccharide biosynthesis protein [Hymenobacter tenuis]
MLRRIVRNFATRLATAFLSFGIVWLTAHYLGAAGRGTISLFVTDCALLLLFIGLFGGSSLIYLAPRRNLWHLLGPAYGWAVVVCLAGTATIAWLRHPEAAYLQHLGALSVLQAFFSINTSLLLGRRREATYNNLLLLQVALLAVGLGLAFSSSPAARTISTYYTAAYVAFGLPLLLSLVALLRQPNYQRHSRLRLRATARELARHSRGAHFSNIITFANYRLGYYFLAHFADIRAVGVLSVGVALMEAIWLIPRSTALVQYVDLVHTASAGPLSDSTLRVSRLTLLGTFAAAMTLVSLPTNLLTAVFGPEFGAARPLMVLLVPGTLAIAVQLLLSSYFAGLARYRINNWASVLGLGVTLVACSVLVPRLGIRGVALASSLSYLTSCAYLLVQFQRATGLSPIAFLPRLSDMAYYWHLVRKPGR